MLVRLTEICQNAALTTTGDYTLREVYVNPEHVVMIREDARLQKLNEQGLIDKQLSPEHKFTKLTINRGHTGTEIIVIGAPDMVEKTLNNNKQLLRG